MERLLDLDDLIKELPENPGIYQFVNASGEVIYIGKAKNLKKRVQSYFGQRESMPYKQKVMVRHIVKIQYTLAGSESEALLLENNLIKEYKPKYNILLKDDKTYPWICIKKESFPRVIVTRNFISDGSEYFGPYTSGTMVKVIMDLFRQLFQLRTCHLLLNQDSISKGKYKRCLEYHLGNCKGPCEGLQQEADYMSAIDAIRNILNGHTVHVIKTLQREMQRCAGNYEFEKAQMIKGKLEALEKFKGKSTIVNPKISEVDVFSFSDEGEFGYTNYLKIVNGAIVQAHNIEIIRKLEESREEMLSYIVFDIRNRLGSQAREVILPFQIDMSLPGVRFTVPKRGDRLHLLELSRRNVEAFKRDRLSARQLNVKKKARNVGLDALQKDLRLLTVPDHIECFDNSNLQGSNPVAACVVFINGKPRKSEYRHFHIRSVSGPDDYASMEEIISRRYSRLVREGKSLPDLIVIDGGKGQLSVASRVIDELGLGDKVAIIGIAKRLEEIYRPGDPVPLHLDKTGPALKLISRLRDEAHRFGISFHRSARSKSMLQSAYDDIKGLGQVAKEKLLAAGVQASDLSILTSSELETIIGKRPAAIYRRYLAKKQEELSNDPG